MRAVFDGLKYVTYSFSYADITYAGVNYGPHLMSITNHVGSGESYSVIYHPIANLYSPFGDPNSFGATFLLEAVTQTGTGLRHTFEYPAIGRGAEVVRVVLPLGGSLRYVYGSYTYAGNRTIREVASRHLRKSSTSAETAYTFTHAPQDPLRYTPALMELRDPTNIGHKAWEFHSDPASGWLAGYLHLAQEHLYDPTPRLARQQQYIWMRHGASDQPYVGMVNGLIDPTKPYARQTKTDQTIDQYGNLRETRLYGFGNLTLAEKVYTHFYQNAPAYLNAYIRNRLYRSYAGPVSNPTEVLLVTNLYDSAVLTNRTGLRQHDINSGPGHTVRGNVTQSTTPNSVRNQTYDITGTVVTSNNGYGSSVAITPTANNAAPGLITPNSTPNLATSYTYTPVLAPDTVTQPNAEANKTEYDLYGRVSKTISPRGAATTYSYAYPVTTATTNTRWTRTTSDGLGRAVKVEAGYGSTVSTIVETEYDSCACSPTGKVKRVSLPYAPGGTPVWTVYTYDGLGRTLSVALPSGAGSTTYLYEGSTVTVTDPATKWKKYEQDAFGNLVKVTEPKPGTALTYETTYAYDIFNRLRTVTMPRDGTTQTRTWVYDANQRLSIVTTPESGTTTYSYNANGTLAQKTDAKNQRVTYDYDLLGRVTKINRFATGAPTRDTCQSVDLTWDVPTLTPPGAIAFYTFGRLTRAEWGNAVTANCKGGRIQENYDYDVTGVLRYKQMMITRDSVTKQLDGTWLYDTEGRMLDESYPGYGPQMGYGYDAMGRPNLLRHYWLNPGGTGYLHRDFVLNAQYLVGGQLSSIQYQAGMSPDNWTYNTLGQVTNFTTGALTVEYPYSASANNGRITHQVVDGVEVAYTYDSLNRLIAAQTTAPTGGWGQSYTFDGFGNLTAQTPTKGVTPPPMSLTINPATNRLTASTYDANGNMLQVGAGSPVRTYDIENRVVNNGQGGEFAYDLSNRRIWDGQNYWFWAPDGRLLGRYQWSQNLLGIDTRVYFAGRMIGKATTIWVTPNHTRREFTFQRVTRDRLGSVRVTETGQKLDYFPYGEERPTATANGKDKFGTYFRDGELDYANQRYYDYARGRFASVDPFEGSARLNEPTSWNKYAYVEGDPINSYDPLGLSRLCIYRERPGREPVYGPCPYVDDFSIAQRPRMIPPETCDDNVGERMAGLTSDAYAALAVVLGENSVGLIGSREYIEGDAPGSPTGRQITRTTVYVESASMVGVLINRYLDPTRRFGNSIHDVASQPNQFLGYQMGQGRIRTYLRSRYPSRECLALMLALDAVTATLTFGTNLDPRYLYWKAVLQVDENGQRFIRGQSPSDFRIGGTDFHQ